MPFLLVIAALILLVVLHELGHFLAAKAVGIRATKFYVFFPPAIFKRTVGEVEYGIGAIPAGGFVKMPGMFEPVPREVAEKVAAEYEQVLPLVRDGDLRLQLDAARRAVAQAEHPDGLVAPLTEIRDAIAQVREDTGPAAPRAVLEQSRERVVALLDDAHPRAYWRAALWRRMTVIFAGPFVNLLIAFVVLACFYWFLYPKQQIQGPITVGAVSASSPAEQAGLEEGSRVIRWNGPVDGLFEREFAERIEDGRGKPATITWEDEDGVERTRTIEPTVIEEGEPARLGVNGWEIHTRPNGREVTSFSVGTRAALSQMQYITTENLKRLPRVFFDSEVRDDVGSVVGIVQVADDVDRAGQIIGYVAIISLILAVMNLLPLLPLDGGHLLFGLLEAVRRKPMPRAAYERYSLVGLVLVLMLFFIGLDNDIGRARG